MADDESEFRATLEAVVSEASESGVTVRGGWDIRNADSDALNWTVEITNVANPPRVEEDE